MVGISQCLYFISDRQDSNSNICTVEALQRAKRYILREDAMPCCLDAWCNAVRAARACNITHFSVSGEPSMAETDPP